MSIIFYELKKIWNVRILCITAVFCLLYYFAFMNNCIARYPDGHPAAEDIYLAAELTRLYGAVIEPEEFAEFMQIRGGLTEEADRFIAENQNLAEMGITDYASFDKTIYDLSFDDSDEARAKQIAILREYWQIGSGDNTPKKYYMLRSLDSMADLYNKGLDIEFMTRNYNSARFEQMLTSGEYQSAISITTVNNTVDYVKSLAVLLIIATLILVSPLMATDRIRKMHRLQYSSKQGRKIVRKQLAAVLLSSVLLTTFLILVFGIVYARNGTQVFWNSYVSSFFSLTFLTVPLTFGQYVLAMAGMLYAAGLAISAAVFAVSGFCGNYIALAAWLAPVFAAAYYLYAGTVFYYPLTNKENDFALYEPAVCAVLLVIGVIAACVVAIRERRAEV